MVAKRAEKRYLHGGVAGCSSATAFSALSTLACISFVRFTTEQLARTPTIHVDSQAVDYCLCGGVRSSQPEPTCLQCPPGTLTFHDCQLTAVQPDRCTVFSTATGSHPALQLRLWSNEALLREQQPLPQAPALSPSCPTTSPTPQPACITTRRKLAAWRSRNANTVPHPGWL